MMSVNTEKSKLLVYKGQFSCQLHFQHEHSRPFSGIDAECFCFLRIAFQRFRKNRTTRCLLAALYRHYLCEVLLDNAVDWTTIRAFAESR